jgi:hypothetical protein
MEHGEHAILVLCRLDQMHPNEASDRYGKENA